MGLKYKWVTREIKKSATLKMNGKVHSSWMPPIVLSQSIQMDVEIIQSFKMIRQWTA